MRIWTGLGATRRAPLAMAMAVSLAGLVGLALGGTGGAQAQGMMSNGGGAGAYRDMKGPAAYGYRAKPRPRVKGRYYRPRTIAPKTCGEFRYWSPAKGQCLDARTAPPSLKPR